MEGGTGRQSGSPFKTDGRLSEQIGDPKGKRGIIGRDSLVV